MEADAGSAGARGGWRKYAGNPVLGGDLGVCFDVCLLKEARYRMWFSWRTRKSVAVTESDDGIHWATPRLCVEPDPASGWETDINRPSVVRVGDVYHMWYTGQTWNAASGRPGDGWSSIGHATSPDGAQWRRTRREPVLSPDAPWEKVAVMCPHVLWDEAAGRFTMWYSGGEQYEPNAIGAATSPDGVRWTKYAGNPIFSANPELAWERHKCTACQVIRHGGWHYLFYIGFEDEHRARIGVARSRDGLTGWERSARNPLISPDPGAWDADACYKPFVIPGADRWLLWYNGRRGTVEQIGLAILDGAEPLF